MRLWHMFVTVFLLFGIGMAAMLNPAPSGGLMGDIAALFGGSAAPSVPTSLLARPSAVDATAPRAALTSACPSIDLRLLVIAADDSDTVLPAIRQTLDYLGTPYAVWLARERPGELTPSRLADGCHSYYQGVILSTGELVDADETGAPITALTEAEWAALRAFEQTFGLRQLSWYTFPTSTYGFQVPEAIDTGDVPIDARFTDAGRAVFASVNTARPLTIANAYTYLAYPAADASLLPLMVDETGHALAAIHTTADGRENLVLTFDSNQHLPHTLAVAYDLVHWVTRGLFLGERHAYLGAQIDDVFIPNALAEGGNYRINGFDFKTVVGWQRARQAQPTTRALRLSMVFVGYGITPGRYRPDTLTPMAKEYEDEFEWINHTYDHVAMHTMSFETARAKIEQNTKTAQMLHLTNYSPLSLVTPEVSGLDNPQVLQAAYDTGVRYMVSDTSRAGQNNPSPNAGIHPPDQPGLLLIPRYPNNLGYDVTTPDQWVDEYNRRYRALWGRDLTYAEIIDKESSILLAYLLKGDMDPWMFHQSNLRAYDEVHTLLGDLLDRVLEKYDRLSTVPILSPAMGDLGQRMAKRMQYDAADVAATVVPGESITLSARNAATVPVTGLRLPDAETYGNQTIAYIALGADQTITVPLP